MSSIDLKPIIGKDDEASSLQRVLEEAPGYSMRIMGHPPGPAEAQSTFTILPPNMGYEDKFVFGIYLSGRMIGCVDLIRGYPDRKTAMLGLLLLSEKFQGKGYGRLAYQKVEEIVSNWAGIGKIRIGIVGTNDHILTFWKKMGFVDAGVRKPYSYDKLKSETFVFEKIISSKKSRCTMRVNLTKALVEEKFATKKLTVEDAAFIGKLMEQAYRGTIDDDGETLDQFIAEARATLSGKYGRFVSDASFWIEDNGKAISATLVTLWKDEPLLAFSITDPDYQRKGFASFLIRKTMKAMADLGYSYLDLGVTLGNPAKFLYEKLGFEVLSKVTSSMTDEEFLRAFEDCTISKNQWKHKDHLRMAWLYLKAEQNFESALQKIRIGIQRLNLSHGNDHGYHETVTQVFAIYILDTILNSDPKETFDDFSTANPWLYDGINPFRKRHYSDALWKSEEARHGFVSADILELPNPRKKL